LPESELDELPSLFLRLFRQAQAMQLNLEELNGGVNPASQIIFEDLSFQPGSSVESMVKAVRKYLGIDVKTQVSWRDTDVAFKAWRNKVEESGVFVFKEAFKQDEISGFCLYDDTFPVIYINNSMPTTRQIFTLFHELGHLLLKASGITKRNDAFIRRIHGDNKKIEVLCNRFAGEFLVPKADFDIIVSNIQIDEQIIQDLANRYSVSREVILRRCLEKKLIDRSYYEQKSKQWIKEAKEERVGSKGGNYYFNKATYLGDNYLGLVFKKYYQSIISVDQVAEYLGVKIGSIAGLETAFLARGETA
jgi:Zn-dependent peptidase ImmA (M78 family)